MTALTGKQKKLLQKDKYELVDNIVFLENELSICSEANITAQQEIDGEIKPKTLSKEQSNDLVVALNKSIGLDGLNHQLQDKFNAIEKLLDKVWDGSIGDKEFRLDITTIMCTEGGENGSL